MTFHSVNKNNQIKYGKYKNNALKKKAGLFKFCQFNLVPSVLRPLVGVEATDVVELDGRQELGL